MIKNKCHCGLIRCNLHRESKQPFYRKYVHIRSRCTFEWDKDYKNYGARGIKFEWKSYQDFKKDMYLPFLKHVKKHGIKNTTIDRLDVNGNYCKNNCKWVTLEVQVNNKRNSRKYTLGKEERTVAQWAKKVGISRNALLYRLNKGLDIKTAISMKISHSNKYAKTL